MENLATIVSLGTGGSNLGNSVRRIISNDIRVMLKGNNPYSEIAKDAFGYIYGDTNHGALKLLASHERLPLGKSGGGSRRDPRYVIDSFMEVVPTLKERLGSSQVVGVIATGGKNTGRHSFRPCCRAIRDMKNKLVIPVFALPSSDQGEISEERHDECLQLIEEMKADGFRIIVILNDASYKIPGLYDETYEQLNLQFAKGFRSLLWSIVERRQLDESDHAIIWAGGGYSRLAHIDLPRNFEKGEGLLKRIGEAVESCYQNTFYGFPENAKIGESIMCIQGDWQKSTFGEIRGSLTRRYNEMRGHKNLLASIVDSRNVSEPWGITMLLNEFTGMDHRPLDLDWSDRPMLDEMLEEIQKKMPIVVNTAPLTDPSFETPSSVLGSAASVAEVFSRASKPERAASLAGDALTVKAAQHEVLTPHVPFEKFISLMNSRHPQCLEIASNGNLSDLVALTVEEVIDWHTMILLRRLVTDGKFSTANQEWIYNFILTASRKASFAFKVRLPDGLKTFNLLTEDQMVMYQAAEGSVVGNGQIMNWARTVKEVHAMWGWEKAVGIIKPGVNAFRSADVAAPGPDLNIARAK